MNCFASCLPGLAGESHNLDIYEAKIEDEAFESSEREDVVFFKMGSEAQDSADWKAAIKHFTKAVNLDRNNANYLYHLAYCLQEVAPDAGIEERVLHEKALGHYLQVLAINPMHHEAWYNLGYVQEELQRFEDAIVSFKKALEIDPKDKDALINLGNCYMSLNEFGRSVETYRAAIQLEPDCVMSHYNLASAHHSAATACEDPNGARQHYASARTEFQEAIRLNPEYADAYFNLGICYQDEGDDANARRMYSKAIELQPDMEEASEAIKALNPVD